MNRESSDPRGEMYPEPMAWKVFSCFIARLGLPIEHYMDVVCFDGTLRAFFFKGAQQHHQFAGSAILRQPHK